MDEARQNDDAHTAGPADRLDSWKEIAAYLRRSPRTVQRWERQEGLPVHRLVHDKLGSVYAYRSELDGWWAERRSRLEAEAEDAQPESVESPNAVTAPSVAAPLRPRRRRAAAAAAVAAGGAGRRALIPNS
jgi:hypothetical protein